VNLSQQEAKCLGVVRWFLYSGVARGQGGQAPPGARVGGAKMSKTFKKIFY